MGDPSLDIEQDVGGAAADVDHGDTDLLLVVAEDGLGAGEGLEHHVGHREAAALGAADDVLHAARGGRDEVDLHAEAHPGHADGVADAVLAVDHVLAGQDVEDLPVGVYRDGPRSLEHPLDVAGVHLTAGDGRYAVAGRRACNVAAADADVDGPDLDAGHRLRGLDRVLDGADRPVDVGDDALAEAAARDHSCAEDRDPFSDRSISATTAHTFVVPISRPTTISPCEAAVLISPPNRMPRKDGPVQRGPGRASQRMRTTTLSGRASLSSMTASALAPRSSELCNHAGRLIELAPEWGPSEHELHGAAAHDEGEPAVRLHVHLLEGQPPSEPPVVVFGGEVDGPADRAQRSLAIVGQRLGADPGHERQVDRIARVDALEGFALGAGQPYVAQGDQRRRLALGDVDEDGAGQATGEGRVGEPRIGQQTGTRRVEVGAEDVRPERDPALGDDGVGGAAIAPGHLDVGDGEAGARQDVGAGRPSLRRPSSRRRARLP